MNWNLVSLFICFSLWTSSAVCGEKPAEGLLAKTSRVTRELTDSSGDDHTGDSFQKGGKGRVRTLRLRRSPTGFTVRGFHQDFNDRDFGHFSPVKRGAEKRRPEADSQGFYGDTFSGGFGDFETMKRNLYLPYYHAMNPAVLKRRSGGSSGFHGDTFAQGFGDFDTMKRAYPYNNWAVKRRPEMSKTGFHDDVFNSGFGEFHPMRK